MKIKLKIKKILPIILVDFQMTFSALKKCCILHIENITSNKKKSSIKVLMNIVLITCIFEV